MSSLAAARADNFYYPPGWTPEQGSLNKYHGQHALRERARKLDQGILIIRFEMPFHIWCGGCKAMIAKGVRFNAEKKQIGNYHSTKIWSFKMKAACCQHEIEIHTDPKNCDYVVASGAEKKVVDYDPEEAGTSALPTEEEREKLADPFYKVEHAGRDAKKARSIRPELIRMKDVADARHADTWRLNSQLRADLRAQKKRVAAEVEEARDKGLGIRLLPEDDSDKQAAALASFQPHFEQNRRDRRAAIRASSIFAEPAAAAGRGDTSGAKGQPEPSSRHPSSCLPSRHGSNSGAAGASRSAVRSSCHGGGGRGLGSGQAALAQGSKRRDVTSGVKASSALQRQAELALKRRRIDGRGVLEVAAGRS